MSVKKSSNDSNVLFLVQLSDDDEAFDVKICKDTTIEECAVAIAYLIKTVVSMTDNPIDSEKAEMILFDKIQEIILEDETISVDIEDED